MIFTKKTKAQPTDTPPPPVEEGGLTGLSKSIAEADLPSRARDVAYKELTRLEKTDPSVAEYSIGLNYLEFLLALPWNMASVDNLDISRAEKILNDEHYGLMQVKERVLEYLATRIVCSLRQFHVLVVDDEEIARDNISYALRKDSCEVLGAANGQEALDILSKTEIDLVITDLKMDKVNGLELLDKAKTLYPTVDFILVTGYATVDTAVNAMQKGAHHYLPKPLNLDVLRRSVKEVRRKQQHVHMSHGPILCFTGPPGTGKTSIGRSVANALQRQFIRLSMAGMRDEAELRGHRRTYVGSMAGRIINELRRVNANNPVFMLDEVDKIGQDFRGDPCSVLLEVLDPEQNKHFLDYYLDIPFDLSNVMFITTANALDKLPAPLLDRMETITFPSYTPGEKRRIGLDYLLPRQLTVNGRGEEDVHFEPQAMDALIRGYTRGAGLRGLEREIGNICRKINRRALQNEFKLPVSITPESVGELLGPARFVSEAAQEANIAGVTTGLVWTEAGGCIIFIETARMRGKGNLLMTGSLGDVLKESAQTALSYVRSNAESFGIDETLFEQSDIHVHIPSGSIPKDGPSAGLTIAMAFVSLMTGRPARRDVAMSGELTLSGRVLPISGLRDKILAAQEAGVRTVLLPTRCKSEVNSLEEEVRKAAEIIFIEDAAAAVDLVMEAG